ncbi:hypothetical protein [Legionella feeleii]|uniref:Uncharacterized protein n=1 Tax=Legionella feeleii TaxID=453 RepID=A0A0W0U266_9GAMM|nr:hypothetical protein [Legionella feeleii]KTD02021.1 hypothetical protein Lfee_0866 [Legionella feeleii]SPX59896.1 Uncharacterised protein [Legionella feeleii]
MANDDSIFVFVKGNKAKFAYEITDSHFNELHHYIKANQSNNGKPTSPIESDFLAIEDSLFYIKQNRGNGFIPANPVVKVFTSYEKNYEICSTLNKPDKFSQKLKSINQLKNSLARFQGDRDQVKFHWLPKKFKNCMEDVDNFLKDTK